MRYTGFHYLTSMGRNLENRKKLTPVRTMNNDGMNIVNSVDNFGNNVAMNNIFSEQ